MRALATYAGALATALPLVIAIPAAAQESASQSTTEHDVELIGTVTAMVEVDRPTCPPDYLCFDSTYLMTLADIRQLSGPPMEGPSTFTVSLHSAYQPGMIVRLRVRDTGGERWQVIERRIMGYDDAAPLESH